MYRQQQNLGFRPKLPNRVTDTQFKAKVFHYGRQQNARDKLKIFRESLNMSLAKLKEKHLEDYIKKQQNRTNLNNLKKLNKEMSEIEDEQHKQITGLKRKINQLNFQLAINLTEIHNAILRNPHRALLIPKNMLPSIEFRSQNAYFHLGSSGLHTRTNEFAVNRKRVKNTLNRCQSGEGSSKTHATAPKRNQNLNVSSVDPPKNVSSKPRLCSTQLSSASKQRRNTNTWKLYHTIAKTGKQNLKLQKNLRELKPSSIGEFDGNSYWHTDPMFQWPGVHKNTSKKNPNVEATFVLTAPRSIGTRYCKRLNRDGSGTGTTIVLPSFQFRVDRVVENPNHGWTQEYHIQMLKAD